MSFAYIYALVDPRISKNTTVVIDALKYQSSIFEINASIDYLVSYVGKTTNSLNRRLNGHCSIKSTEISPRANCRKLKREGIRPLIIPIITINTSLFSKQEITEITDNLEIELIFLYRSENQADKNVSNGGGTRPASCEIISNKRRALTLGKAGLREIGKKRQRYSWS